MRVGQYFLLPATFLGAAAAATAVFGQTVPTSPGQAPASVPDFSGIWAHLTWPDVEAPVSGPGPVTNTSRPSGVSNVYLLIGDYTNPILKPEAAQVVKRAGENMPPLATLMRPSQPVRHFWQLRNQRFFCSRLRSGLLVERFGMHTRLTPLAFAAASFLPE